MLEQMRAKPSIHSPTERKVGPVLAASLQGPSWCMSPIPALLVAAAILCSTGCATSSNKDDRTAPIQAALAAAPEATTADVAPDAWATTADAVSEWSTTIARHTVSLSNTPAAWAEGFALVARDTRRELDIQARDARIEKTRREFASRLNAASKSKSKSKSKSNHIEVEATGPDALFLGFLTHKEPCSVWFLQAVMRQLGAARLRELGFNLLVCSDDGVGEAELRVP